MSFVCPIPTGAGPDRIELAHGEGGRLSRQLLRDLILPALGCAALEEQPDAAILPISGGSIAVSTDGYVVSPLFFPGGDIGSLAVHGAVNDLAAGWSTPRALCLGMVIEEGFSTAMLLRVLNSFAAAARAAKVNIACGDTKVVPRGAADQLFLTVTAIGMPHSNPPPGPKALEAGDQLLVTGPVGQHGTAVLAAREKLPFEPPIRTDSASLVPIVDRLHEAGLSIRAVRDATRGGLAAVLHEWSLASDKTLVLDAEAMPVSPEVRGACELLGLDPVFVACEGVLVLAVPSSAASAALECIRALPIGSGAAVVGAVRGDRASVLVRRSLRREQPLDEPIAALLPRIC